MYLISIYFDEQTEKNAQFLINQIATKSGNTFMTDGKIPPHITVLAFDTADEHKAVELLEKNVTRLGSGDVFFASVGAFRGQVVYAEPVLNEYLHNISTEIYSIYKDVPGIKFSPYYKPFGWIPHMSLGKHLNESQMEEAFKVLLKYFSPFESLVTRIGIAKTNPHRDIKIYNL